MKQRPQVCIDKTGQFLSTHQINGEIIASDNGSTDGSPEITVEHATTLIHVTPKGNIRGGLRHIIGLLFS